MAFWKDAGFIGAVVAALIAAVVALVVWYPSPDKSPPSKPTILDIKKSIQEDDNIEITYDNAEDEDGGSGLKEVQLWKRHVDSTSWSYSGFASTAIKGVIYYNYEDDNGTYFFDLVAFDQSDNSSAVPQGVSTGQRKYAFAFRSQNNLEPVTTTLGNNDENLIASGAVLEGDIVIPIIFHLVMNDTLHMGRRIKSQVGVLNDAFGEWGITFASKKISWVKHENIESTGSINSIGWEEIENIKRQFVETPNRNLNVFVADLQGGLLELSTFPWDLEDNPELDGSVIHNTAFAGGVAPFDKGKSLVHGIGHMLGLYHTFQDGCSGNGDYVDDTPAHQGPNYAAPGPSSNNACDPNDMAPFRNFMNYGDDEIAGEFTLGQIERVRKIISIYRNELLLN